MFQRRDNNTPHFPGMLTFFGGVIETGEISRQAALRELNEETSIGLSSVDELMSLGISKVKLEAGLTLTIHLFETAIDSPDFAVYEGVGAEVYSRDEALLRPDMAEHARTLLQSVVT